VGFRRRPRTTLDLWLTEASAPCSWSRLERECNHRPDRRAIFAEHRCQDEHVTVLQNAGDVVRAVEYRFVRLAPTTPFLFQILTVCCELGGFVIANVQVPMKPLACDELSGGVCPGTGRASSRRTRTPSQMWCDFIFIAFPMPHCRRSLSGADPAAGHLVSTLALTRW